MTKIEERAVREDWRVFRFWRCGVERDESRTKNDERAVREDRRAFRFDRSPALAQQAASGDQNRNG